MDLSFVIATAAQIVVAQAAPVLDPATWWQVAAGQGALGLIVAWFMFRLEGFLKDIPKGERVKAEAMANMTHGIMVTVLALRNLNDQGVRDLAAKVKTDAEEITKRATHESSAS